MLFGATFQQPDTQVPDVPTSIDLAVQEEVKSFRDSTVHLNANPITSWKGNEHRYPRMSVLSRGRLGVAGTNVPSERLFSAAGCLISAKRACISSKNVDMMLFLNKNLK